MGAVSFSLDPHLVDTLCSALELKVFVETGTFKGDTTQAMATRFHEVHSIEFSETLWKAAHTRFKDHPGVTIHHGHSPARLGELQTYLQQVAALYWLDAHWCVASGTMADVSQCPLLQELAALRELNSNSVVLIDDARLFLAPPLAPHDVSQWPTLQQVIRALQALSSVHEVMVVNDVIAFFPPAARDAMQRYGQYRGTDWLAVMHQTRDYENLASQFSHAQRQLIDKENLLQRQHALLNDLGTKETAPPSQAPAAVEEHERTSAEAPADLQHSQALLQSLYEKEEVIQVMAKALFAYRSLYKATWPARVLSQCLRLALKVTRISLRPLRATFNALRSTLQPGLGVLYQHPPKAMVLPVTQPIVLAAENAPRISLVTPSYGQGHYIERTLLSVLEQNYPHLEYFVQDGGSKDDTVAVLQRYQDRLTGWVSELDSGQSQAINHGFLKTSGEIMGWLNSDDLLLPNALATVADYFMRHPDIDVVYGNRMLIDENDQEIGRWIMPGHDSQVLSWVDFVPQETMFWRRRIWDKVGGRIDESFRFAMDWDLLVRFRDAGAQFAHIPQLIGAFRIHEAQKTSASINEIGQQEMTRIRERLLGRQPSHQEIRKAIWFFMLKHLVADRLHRLRH